MIVNIRDRLGRSPYWRDIVWQASGNGLAQAVGVLGMPLLTRVYTPHDFALQTLFLQVVMFVAGLMTWRYEYFIQLPKGDGDAKHLMHLVASLGFIVCIVLMPVSWIFKETFSHWLGDAALAPWLIAAPVTALLVCYATAFQHWVQRKKDYRQSGLSELAGKSTYIGAGLVGGWLVAGPFGLITAPAFSAVGKLTWLSAFGQTWRLSPNLLKEFKVVARRNLPGLQQLARAYARLSSSMAYSHLMLTCTAAIPVVFIAHAYGGKVLGQFALVTSTIYLPAGLIGTAIGQVYYQRAAERWANRKNFSDLWQMTAKRLVLFGLPIYAGAALVAPWAYPFIFGKAWADAGYYATLMAAPAFFSFASSPLDRTSLVVGAWWYLPIWHTIRAATTIGIVSYAWLDNCSFTAFLPLLVAQMSLMYLTDFAVERYFSTRQPEQMT